MDGPTIFLGIVVVAVTAMVIYMFIDVTKYKEMTDQELKDNDKDIATAKQEATTKIAAETKEREGNVNYIIDKTNEANQNLYTRFDKDVTSMQGNLQELNNASAALSSVMRVSGGPAGATGTTGTATGSTVLGGTATNTSGRSITELPGSGTPNLELISSVMATNGMTVKNTMKADKVQLGDKFLLSGVGDAHANDDWLRMFDKDGKGYRGGIAMKNLWTGERAYLNGQTNVSGNLNVRGGSSEHNPGNWWTHLPWSGDNKNYLRGDTEIRGNTNNIGDLNVGRNANIQGRLHFSDASMSKAWSPAGNNTDSYYLEKKVHSPNVSSLRLTLNDDNDESLQIWGGSCAAGDCGADGKMKHRFDAVGNAVHTGSVTGSKSGNWSPAVNVKGPIAPSSLYALKFGDRDSDDHTNETGMGLIKDQPNKKFASSRTLATHIKGDSDYMLYSSGWDPLLAIKGGSGSTYIKGPLKVRHPHGSWTDNASISTQATGGQVGASFAGEHHWSHFPWSDQHTYIRPGREDRSIIIGDVGQNVHLGRNDGGGITQVKSHWLRTRRHIDADIDWGGKGTTLFHGWVTDKSVIGNHKTGGHDMALNAPANTVVSTNPMMVNGDVQATRICTANTCLRGQGDDLIVESKDKTKTIAKLSPGWDKIQMYKNSDGKAPYWFFNTSANSGVYNG